MGDRMAGMPEKWKTTAYKGVRYRLHPTRKNGVQRDRYFSIRYYVDGKRVEEGLGWASDAKEGWTAEKASRVRSELRAAAKSGNGPRTRGEQREEADAKRLEKKRIEDAEAKRNVTFRDYAENQYLPTVLPAWKPETGRKHEEHCRNWLYPFLGEVPLRDIKIGHLNKVKAALFKAGRAPRTMQAIFRTFSMVWNSARDAEIVRGKSPTTLKSFALPKLDNEKERYLSPDEAERLIACVRARSEQAADMALVSLESGLRFGEVAALTWGAINFESRTVLAVDTKGKKNRVVPMTERLHDLLSGMERGGDGGLVFPTRQGSKHRQIPSAFVRGVEDSRLNEGVDNSKMRVSFHVLRHSYASRLVKQSVSLYYVQRLLGHSTPVLTARYGKLADEDLANAVLGMELGEKAAAKKAAAKKAAAEKASKSKIINIKRAGGQ